ncbi:MAG: hypothetical protein Q8P75_00005 [bacterium]|nr:hypothetical protein [bacterium]
MKFLPENQKKTLWSIALLLISIGGIVYLNFFRGGPAPEPTQDMIDQAFQNSRGGSAGPAPVASPTSFQSSSSLLPYGDKIDTSIFELDKYTVLKRSPSLSVSPEELGKENIFE